MPTSAPSEFHISDVIEVIESQMLGTTEPVTDGRRTKVYVKIVEQPASKALRFRYECEGRSAGSIPGVNSTAENKSFPTIQIVGYEGRAVVVASCVTKDLPYKPHPHNLVGKEGCNRGVCTLKMNSDTISFSNLGIQCVKKKDIEDALKVREEIRVDPFRTGFSHRVQPSNIDLNCVRLCFQVFLEGPKKDEFTIPLKPICSEPIYDKKAMSDLTIVKIGHTSAPVSGGTEVILLCEKVAKEDIQVRFYEEVDGDVIWEGFGDFNPTNVHKQVAISFKTPKFRDLEIDRAVTVMVQLRRPSDGASSDPVSFIFTPIDADITYIKRKRHKLSEEGSPRNILNLVHDDDSRSTYVGSVSPDRMHGLHVKREPMEASPSHYSYVGNLSPRYPVASPGAPSPPNAPSPVYIFQQYPTSSQYNIRLPAGGGMMEINPAAAASSIMYQEPTFNNLSNPGQQPGTLLNMDTNSYSMDLSNLDSAELTNLAMNADVNLSENLSSNLTLSERLDGDRQQNHGMTDSFTRVANNELEKLVSLGTYPQSQNE